MRGTTAATHGALCGRSPPAPTRRSGSRLIVHERTMPCEPGVRPQHPAARSKQATFKTASHPGGRARYTATPGGGVTIFFPQMNKEARRLRDWPWSHGGKVEGQPRAAAARGSHPDSTRRKAGPALSRTLPQGLTWSSGREGWQLALGAVSPTAVLSPLPPRLARGSSPLQPSKARAPVT